MKQAAVILADGFEEVEALTQVDFLRRAGIKVDLLGIGGESITGGHGIVVAADARISSYRSVPDAVVIPGGMPGAENIANSSEAVSLIRVVANSGGLIAAICAAPAVVLGKHGLLDGKRATCYPGYEEQFGDGTEFSEDRVVVDGDLITSRGPGTAAEFAIAIIKKLLGDEAAAEIAAATIQASQA
jgi:4-methyl-5(b-hydroxyethyl)-thiazole monophosphate biosynthesis